MGFGFTSVALFSGDSDTTLGPVALSLSLLQLARKRPATINGITIRNFFVNNINSPLLISIPVQDKQKKVKSVTGRDCSRYPLKNPQLQKRSPAIHAFFMPKGAFSLSF